MLCRKVPFKYRVYASFFIIFILFFSLSLYLLNKKKNDVLDLANKNATLLAETVMERINAIIYEQISDVGICSKMTNLSSYAEASNLEYANMPDRDKFMFNMDKQWKGGETNPTIEKILNNKVSLILKEFSDLKTQFYGYPIMPEIFIANKYGTIVGTSGRTTDFYQADEIWYKEGMKANKYFVKDVSYNASSKIYSIELIIQLFDKKQNITGLVKADFNIQKIVSILESIKQHSVFKKMEIELLTKNQIIIYDTSKKSAVLEKKYAEDFASYLEYEKRKHTFIEKEGDREILVARGNNIHEGQFKGLGWDIVIQYDLNEILVNYYVFRTAVYIGSALLLIIMGLLTFFLNRSLLVPIKEILQLGEGVKAGNYENYLEITTKDDIGKLRDLFNILIGKLKEFSQKGK